MPVYSYKALSEKGAYIKGEMAAGNYEELSQKLADKGLLVQQIRRKHSSMVSIFPRRGVKMEEFLLFNQEFIALLRAGLTVSDALRLTANRPKQPVMQRILTDVLEEVNRGSALSAACSRYPEVFNPLYITALETGEKTGDIVNVLRRHQEYLRRKVALNKKIAQSLAYPIFLLITLVVILSVLFLFVMPRFVTMYADFDAELPTPTQIMLDIVVNLHIFMPSLIIGMIVVGLIYHFWVSTESGRYNVDRMKSRLPMLGYMVKLHATAQITRTLSTLLSGGMPLVNAMESTVRVLTNRFYSRGLLQAKAQVVEGKGLAEAMEEERILPATAIKMIEAGEASGKLDDLLEEIAIYYEESLEYRLTRMTSLIEPALMLLMGIFVGGIIIVMYLPIFTMADIIK